ncbi:MAG: hypothetical protein AAFX52_10245 [Pseudomonadota bacterium]
MGRIKKKPPTINLVAEALGGFEAATAPAALLRAGSIGRRALTRRPIIVVPGFGANDWSTLPLRTYLKRCGYEAEGWGLGQNRGGRGLVKNASEISDRWEFDRELARPVDVEVPAICDRFFERVKERSRALGGPVSLIGWSLGGYIAREAAREFPDHVSQVITLGSPINGGPKYTSIEPLFKLRGANLELIEETIKERNAKPINVPITAIYGTRDGIVSDFAAIDTSSPKVRNIQVSASHFGMGFSSSVWSLVQRTLEEGDKRSA